MNTDFLTDSAVILSVSDYKRCGENTSTGCKDLYLKDSDNFQVSNKKKDGLDHLCKCCRSFANCIRYREKTKLKKEEHDMIGFNGINEIYC